MTVSRFQLAVVLLILAAGVGYFFLRPQWAEVGALRTEIRGLHALRDELRELALIRDKLVADYGAVSQSDIAKLRGIVPLGPHAAALVVDLEAIAAKSGVPLAQVNVSAGQSSSALRPPTSRPAPLPVSFTVSGTYESLQTFLANLERNRRLIDVTDFSFAPAALGAVPVSFQVRAYYRP